MEQRRGPHLLRLLRGDAATGPTAPAPGRPRAPCFGPPVSTRVGFAVTGRGAHGWDTWKYCYSRKNACGRTPRRPRPCCSSGRSASAASRPPTSRRGHRGARAGKSCPTPLNFPAETQTLFGVLSRPYNPLRAARTGPAAQVCLLRRLPGGAGDRCLAPSAPTCRVQVRPAGPPCRDQAGLASSAPQPSARCGPLPPPRLCLCSDPRGPLEDGGGRPTRTPHKTRSVS